MLFRSMFLFLGAGAMIAGATSYIFSPTLPTVGGNMEFQMFDVSITQPTSGNLWTVVIDTNYGAPIPGIGAVIPAWTYREFGAPYAIADFLITFNGVDYGLALTAHDGYVPGDLYQVPGFQTSGQVIGATVSPRPSDPVLLSSGGTLIGTGTLTGQALGDGINSALYEITDKFTAPANFLSTGTFSIISSSYVCANGEILGNGNFGVPEIGTLLPCVVGLLLIAYKFARRSRRTVVVGTV